MEFIRGLINLSGRQKPCAATIGNFDGVHLGHQAVLDQLKGYATESGLNSTVMIFEPQPIEFFAPDRAPSRLTRLREKLLEFQQHGIDRVVCVKFNKTIASLSADEFVQQVLVDGLQVQRLVIGDDFRFAKNREGDFHTLIDAGKRHGFEVNMMQSFNCGDERISSTLIRQALADGDINKANRMLGRPYRISGRVVHGDKRGRKLGFATANIELKRYQSPVFGIFSGRVYGIGNAPLDAAIYVGSRPVYQGERVLLEVHILDFNETIYGRQIQVEFLEKLRGEGEIKTEQELIEQIQTDISNVRNSLKNNPVQAQTA